MADQACLRLRLPDSVRESAHKLWTVEVVRQVWVEGCPRGDVAQWRLLFHVAAIEPSEFQHPREGGSPCRGRGSNVESDFRPADGMKRNDSL